MGVAVVAVAVGVLVFALSSPEKSGQGTGAATQAAIAIKRVTAFDPPPGDGEEHNADVGNLIDGRPDTTWRTQTYFDALQKTKKGVGVIIEAGGTPRRLVVSPANTGWSAQVYVADRPASTLEGWGAPAASRSAIRGDVSFDLGKRAGHAVLLWITDLGEGNVVAIRELRLTG
jgi:hypothetical protein